MPYKEVSENQAEKLLKAGIKNHAEGNIYEAEKYYKKFLESNYINPDVLTNYGVICKQRGDKQKAIELYKKAVKLYPKNAEAFSNLGSLLLELNKAKEAVLYLKKAVVLKKNFANAHYNLGAALIDLERFEEAELSTKKAIEINPEEARAHCNLGAILKNLGQLEEAKSSLQKALKLNKDLVRTYFVLSLIINNKENFEQEEYLFSREIIENKSKQDVIDINFARSNIKHKQKEYTQSAKFLQEANTIKLSIYPSDLNYLCKKNKRLQEEAKTFLKEERRNNNEKDSIFIVGLPRSGSTLLESVVSMNPIVKDLGEVNYLEEAYLEWGKNKNQSLEEIYLSKLPELTNNEKITTNKWLYNFQYTGIISKCMPSAKIIYCVRNPFDNILSIYRAHFALGNRFSSSIEDTAKLYLEEKKLMKNYIEQFPKNIYKINYESVVKNSESTIKNLIEWLGWEWDKKYLSPELNNRSIATASSVQARSRINTKSISSWKNYSILLEPAINIISKEQSLIV